MSTATSKISPETARTSFPCGRRSCACRPRNVPRVERDSLSCTNEYAMPASRYLRSWNVSKNQPRASRNTSGSTRRTSGSSVGTTRMGPRSTLESIAVAAHGEEVARLLRIALQLDAQRSDEVVDRARRALVLRAPAAGEDVVAAQRAPARLQEEPQDLELLRRHLDRRAVARDGLSAEV